ncbi:MAG: glycosyltransferase family 2 protein [Armatimonadota bacterium]
MQRQQRIVVIMPAYNAAETLEQTLADVPEGWADDVIVVDDCSVDHTVEVARRLGLYVIVHPENRGYGGNQKTCYHAALERGADVVVMLHPDYQYDPRRIPALVKPIVAGDADMMLGSRLADGQAVRNGMPFYKYLANRFLTIAENMAFGTRFSELHTGMRAYRREVLESLPLDANSDDFVFDSQVIAQALHFGFRIGEIQVSARYTAEVSSIGFRRSVVYGLATLATVARYVLHRLGIKRSPLFTAPSPRAPTVVAEASTGDAQSGRTA